MRSDYRKSKGDKRTNRDYQTVEKGSSSGAKSNDRGRFQGHQPWKKNKGNLDVQRDGVPNQGRQGGIPQTGQEQWSGSQQRRQAGPFTGRCYHCREIGHPAKMCPKAKQGQYGQPRPNQPLPLPAPPMPRGQVQNVPALPAPPFPPGQPPQQLHHGRVYNFMPHNAQAPQAIEGYGQYPFQG
ncbi:uncharacterized protein LOC132273369 [Cornus florida]|uniref:uncharacterized protein LOC132273369 n=1 Tax=Cornus florida TaxID=4283 RepID=UPI00289D98AF|nr:uncharacterized protein LOC132273369 [Cornus florida]